MNGLLTPTLDKPAYDDIEDRREIQSEESNPQHTAEDRRAQCPTHLSTCSYSKNKRYYTKDECKGCH